MFIHSVKIILFFVLITALILPSFQILAQEKNLDELCLRFEELEKKLSPKDYQELLERCEAYYVKIVEQFEVNLTKLDKEKRTRLNQISILRNKIAKLDAQIEQGNIAIRNLRIQIKETEFSIKETSLKIKDSREKLAAILRAVHREDQRSFTEVFLKGETLSDFFNNLMALEALNIENKRILGQIEALKLFLEEQKELAMNEKEAIGNIVTVQLFQKKEGDRMKRKEERLYRMADVEFNKYQKEKAEAEKKAVEIREKLWRLLTDVGVRDIPTVEEAVQFAKAAQEKTGIRAAFLLGLITQESALGRNVGQCYLIDFNTGMGINRRENNRKWPRIMKVDRDIVPFKKIIADLNQILGLDITPHNQVVSCWIAACARTKWNITSKGVSVDIHGNIKCPRSHPYPFGFGGAMGPAQFIPSTWIRYQDDIQKITRQFPDPWNFQHAILAAGLKLGRDCKGLPERNMAACYFGGWGGRNTLFNLRTHADPVLWFARCWQGYINTGSMSEKCRNAIGI